uniref:Uncharacterized protein LOC104224964 n=1 Tax=Nicotiana sylvestris TaxID=4096 RepID=A0A1U7W8Q1_NICSY|nr:PREDICTED: uncharacterized protein LOC104224964 [Nicotiana sylvestris]
MENRKRRTSPSKLRSASLRKVSQSPNMAFWGAFIEPGKPYTLQLHNNKRRVRISQATLGERSGLWKSRSIVQCAIGSRFLSCRSTWCPPCRLLPPFQGNQQ